MRINSGKTKILVCARWPAINANIYLEKQLISEVSSFKYMESLITSDGRNSQEIKQRIGQAKSSFIKKKKILVLKKISRAIKKTFLKTFVWSFALYGLYWKGIKIPWSIRNVVLETNGKNKLDRKSNKWRCTEKSWRNKIHN